MGKYFHVIRHWSIARTLCRVGNQINDKIHVNHDFINIYSNSPIDTCLLSLVVKTWHIYMIYIYMYVYINNYIYIYIYIYIIPEICRKYVGYGTAWYSFSICMKRCVGKQRFIMIPEFCWNLLLQEQLSSIFDSISEPVFMYKCYIITCYTLQCPECSCARIQLSLMEPLCRPQFPQDELITGINEGAGPPWSNYTACANNVWCSPCAQVTLLTHTGIVASYMASQTCKGSNH